MNFYWKFTSKFGIIFVLQSLLGSLFLALRTTLALMRRCVRSQELCARTMTMEDAYQVKITLQSRAPNVDSNSLIYFWFYCTAHAALCATHIGFMCIMTQNGRVTHGPWNSWWNYIMIIKWYGLSNMKVYGTILVWVEPCQKLLWCTESPTNWLTSLTTSWYRSTLQPEATARDFSSHDHAHHYWRIRSSQTPSVCGTVCLRKWSPHHRLTSSRRESEMSS